MLQTLSDRTGTTGEMLRAYVRQVGKWMAISGYRDECPITKVLLELAPQDRAVCEAGRRASGARLHVLERKLVANGVTGPRAQRLAMVYMTSISGALVQSRIERSSRPLDIVAEELAAWLQVSGLK